MQTSFGIVGVDLFFVISGFIMVVSTHGRPVSAGEFIRRRLIRVAPMYWLLTLLMVGIWSVAPGVFKTLQVSPDTLLKSLFFIPHFSSSFPDQVWPLLVPGWTLNFEMFFYGLFALSLLAPAPVRVPLLTLTLLGLVGMGLLAGPFSAAWALTYTSPRLLEFGAGALIGGRWVTGRLRVKPAVAASMIAVGMVLLGWHDATFTSTGSLLLGASLVVMGALGLPDSALARSKLAQALGDSSYSLYLTHLFTLGAVRMVWPVLVSWLPWPLSAGTFLVVAMASCACVGWLSWRLLEAPLTRRLSRTWR